MGISQGESQLMPSIVVITTFSFEKPILEKKLIIFQQGQNIRNLLLFISMSISLPNEVINNSLNE